VSRCLPLKTSPRFIPEPQVQQQGYIVDLLINNACVWYYRRQLHQDFQPLLMKGIYPFPSAIFLLVVGIYQLTQFDRTVAYLSIGAIAIGILPMLYIPLKISKRLLLRCPEAFE
jgi:hypothetical protein